MFSELYKGRDLSAFRDQLRRRGAEFGLVFGDRPLLSNSRMALEAGEFARDAGVYEAFHPLVFYSYFTEGLDIGKFDVIAAAAEKSGLDREGRADLRKALDEERYRPRLEDARREGEAIGLTGVPTFIVNKKYKITGAQEPAVFRECFGRLGIHPRA